MADDVAAVEELKLSDATQLRIEHPISLKPDLRNTVREAWKAFIHTRFKPYVTTTTQHCDRDQVDMAELELDVLREMLLYATQQRNKAVGACSLPPEILGSIFLLAREGWNPHGTAETVAVCADEDSSSSNTVRLKYSLGWMNLLQVCGTWRQVALGTPELWTFLRCLDVHPQSIPALLARSRLLPLTIHADAYDTMPDGVKNSIPVRGWLSPAVFRRTRELILVSAPNAVLQSWFNALCHPMVHLEKLELGGHEPLKSDNKSRPMLPANLFSQVTPMNLKRMELVDVGFSWSSPLFSSSIVWLKLKFTSSRLNDPTIVNTMPTLQQFSQVISTLPALQLLELKAVFPLDSSNDMDGHAITFPAGFNSLTLFAEDDFVAPCFGLLKHMTLPERATVTVDLLTLSDFREDIATLVPRLYGSSDTALPRELMLTQQSIGLQYVDRPPKDILTDRIPDSTDPWVDFKMAAGGRCFYMSHGTTFPPLISYLPSIPLRTLRTVTCAMDTARFLGSPTVWISTFASAKDVENISINYDGALHLFEALVEMGGDGEFVLFPSLETLSLHSLFHTGKKPGPKAKAKTAELRLALDVALLDLVQLRHEKGAPVKKVLYDCDVGSQDLWDRVKEFAGVESPFLPPLPRPD